MARRYRFVQVDVVTDHAVGGNQLAVVTDARADHGRDAIADARDELVGARVCLARRSSRCGETGAHLLFTPARELPLAGHPPVGTSYVLAREGVIPLHGAMTEIMLALGVGPVPVVIAQRDGQPSFVWMTPPAPVCGPVRDDRARVAAALGMAAFDLHDTWPLQVVSTGVPFLYVPVRSRRATPTRPPSARYSPTAPRHRSWCSAGRRSSRRRRSTRACSRRTRWASPKTPRVVRRPAPWAPPSPTMVVFPWWPRHASSSSRDWRWGGRVRSTSWSAGGMRKSWARGSGAGRDRGRGTPRLGPVGGALTSAACSSHHEPVCRHTSRGAGTCLMEAG